MSILQVININMLFKSFSKHFKFNKRFYQFSLRSPVQLSPSINGVNPDAHCWHDPLLGSEALFRCIRLGYRQYQHYIPFLSFLTWSECPRNVSEMSPRCSRMFTTFSITPSGMPCNSHTDGWWIDTRTEILFCNIISFYVNN